MMVDNGRIYLVGGLELEVYDFPYIGNVIATDYHIFRGVGIPPTSSIICF